MAYAKIMLGYAKNLYKAGFNPVEFIKERLTNVSERPLTESQLNKVPKIIYSRFTE